MPSAIYTTSKVGCTTFRWLFSVLALQLAPPCNQAVNEPVTLDCSGSPVALAAEAHNVGRDFLDVALAVVWEDDVITKHCTRYQCSGVDPPASRSSLVRRCLARTSSTDSIRVSDHRHLRAVVQPNRSVARILRDGCFRCSWPHYLSAGHPYLNVFWAETDAAWCQSDECWTALQLVLSFKLGDGEFRTFGGTFPIKKFVDLAQMFTPSMLQIIPNDHPWNQRLLRCNF